MTFYQKGDGDRNQDVHPLYDLLERVRVGDNVWFKTHREFALERGRKVTEVKRTTADAYRDEWLQITIDGGRHKTFETAYSPRGVVTNVTKTDLRLGEETDWGEITAFEVVELRHRAGETDNRKRNAIDVPARRGWGYQE